MLFEHLHAHPLLDRLDQLRSALHPPLAIQPINAAPRPVYDLTRGGKKNKQTKSTTQPGVSSVAAADTIAMSTIDRYRPPREGYQPPSLPPKPPPAAGDRLSKSPARRRDVPPAVPSPPAYSARTSPPRPQSRRSAASPAQSSPQRAPQPRPNQWFFTLDEVASSPSILDNLPPAEERLRRAKGVNFIYQAGILLELPQVTLWVAGVFFHRFYMRYSMVEEKGGIHHYVSKQPPRSGPSCGKGAGVG